MSEREKFLSRWSRRKQEAAKESDDLAAKDLAAEATAEPAAPAETNASPSPQEDAPAPFDPTSLPSLDAIDSATDLRAFLAPGVPADLTRAALRRAWSADPAIRDFIGLSENAWDFNAPEAAHGFGPLDTDTVQRLVRHFLDETPSESEPENQRPPPQENAMPVGIAAREHKAPEARQAPSASAAAWPDADDTAVQHEEPAEQKRTPPGRRHGRALPT